MIKNKFTKCALGVMLAASVLLSGCGKSAETSDNNTKTNVIKDTINYSEEINIKSKINADLESSEIIVKALKQPECVNATINGNTIDFEIEKELGIEVVGDTKVKILTEDDEDEWQVFDDKLDEEVSNKIDTEVNENFIN